MNLVKLQEDLKGLPLQALQQYVNGANPEVPPYLAAAEMQRRQASMQRASMAQGAAQGPQPSVKEQLEQKLGLGALQAQQQQQAMQQMAQQGAQHPMPVPAGTPQPEAQPEPPAGMARGGVASLSVNEGLLAYADGGVVGFQAGGATDDRRQKLRTRIARAEAALSSGDTNEQYAQVLQRDIQKAKAELALLDGGSAAPDARLARGPAMAGITDQPPARPTPPPMAAPGGAPTAGPTRSVPRPAPQASAPQPPAEMGIAALAAPMVQQQLTEKIETPTEEQGIASEQKFATQYGYDKPYGAEQRKLMEQMRADYEKRKESRGLETLMATLGGFSRGYGGAAAGYLDAQNAQRAYDDQFARDMLAQTGQLERTDRETALGRGKDAMGAHDTKVKGAADRTKRQQELAGGIYADDQRAKAQRELEMLRQKGALQVAAVRGASGGGGGGQSVQMLRLQKDALDKEIASINADLKTATRAKREELLGLRAQKEDERRRILAMMGDEPAPAMPSGTQSTKATQGFSLVGSRPATP